MLRKALAAVAISGATIAASAMPASAVAIAPSCLGKHADGVASVSTQTGPAAGSGSARLADTTHSKIVSNYCGYWNGFPVVGARSKQLKLTTDTYSMTQTHVVQGRQGTSWVALGRKTFVANAPVGGVWYFAPNQTGHQFWDLTGWTGTFRVKVNFVWKTTSGMVYRASSNGPTCTKS